MNEKDKIIIDDTARVSVEFAATLVDELANSILGFNVVWKLATLHSNAAWKLRVKRSIEWIELIRDNPNIFTQEILQDESFQNGFIFLYQKYIFERNHHKRNIIKNFLKGFAIAVNKDDFELEKFTHILSVISIEDMSILNIWCDGTLEKWLESQKIYSPEDIKTEVKSPLNIIQIGYHILFEMKNLQEFKDKEYTFEKLNYLTSVGLLSESMGTTWDGIGSYKISQLGKKFITFCTID